jgi:hypothetical protein
MHRRNSSSRRISAAPGKILAASPAEFETLGSPSNLAIAVTAPGLNSRTQHLGKKKTFSARWGKQRLYDTCMQKQEKLKFLYYSQWTTASVNLAIAVATGVKNKEKTN